MLCEKCMKNEATYHYRENVNGAEKSFHLCRTCREAMEQSGEISNADLALHSMFGSFGTDPVTGLLDGLFAPMQIRTPVQEKTCACGMTLREFSRSKLAGCPRCWTTFGKELAASVAGFHTKAAHTGRIPGKFRETADLKKRIEALVHERDAAVAQENYERAAQLRDEIRALKMREA